MPKTLFDFFSPKAGKSGKSPNPPKPVSDKTPLKTVNRNHTDTKRPKIEPLSSVSFSPRESKQSTKFAIPDDGGNVDHDKVHAAARTSNEKVDKAENTELREKTLVEKDTVTALQFDSGSDMDQSSVNKNKKKRTLSRQMAKKRRCIESSSSDNAESGEEFIPAAAAESSEEDYESEESSVMESDSSGTSSPVKKSRKRKRVSLASSTTSPRNRLSINEKLNSSGHVANDSIASSPALSQRTKSQLAVFQASDQGNEAFPEANNQTKYLHETLDFLTTDRIQDKNGKRKGDTDYDPTTLKVPQAFIKTLSPAMFQWWRLKSENFDVILCFKVGKFYELYHMDAVVGVNELGLVYMKGNFAHSGFPEIAFGRYSEILVNKGYKVARVEQTETPEQNSIRIKKEGLPRQQRTLRREICRIVTKGTQCLGSFTNCRRMQSGNNFLLAVTERQIDGNNDQCNAKSSVFREFGVCFIDTSVGEFHLGQFSDDRYCSSLCTMICRNPPCQVLYERGRMSCAFRKMLKSGLSSTLQEALNPGSQFWSSAKTIAQIRKEGYFSKDGEEKWPNVLRNMMQDPDAVSLCASGEYDLAFSALGASIFYLQKCLFDHEVLSLGQFVKYDPQVMLNIDNPQTIEEISAPDFVKSNSKMVLDSVTLHNLEILENSIGGTQGTLLNRLDSCYTPPGKRLLKQWLCAPPCNPEISIDRLDAIDDLVESMEFTEEVIEVLKVVPDLERMLMKIHALSKGCRRQDHPENRAVFYEEVKYSKRNIEDFLTILKHYENFHRLLEKYQDLFIAFKSNTLKKYLCFVANSGDFPSLKEVLEHWKTAFNHKKALETGKITPNKGANPEYDDAIEEIQRINDELDIYLREQKKILQCSTVIYKGTGNKRYQLELPMDAANRVKSSQYTISGQRKGYKSFRTPETMEFLKNMERAEARRDNAQADTLSIIFREFDQDYLAWRKAIESMSTIDVLISLTRYCKNNDSEMCRPVFKWNGPKTPPFVDIRDGKHPSMSRTFFDDDFIPNDTLLGGRNDREEDRPTCLVLTGPNMGGKSTLMRQVGLIVILAHLGCRVPASRCVLSPVDRVFTRLGASDRILSGESTFHVEMSETSSILRHATKHSLVLLDELGRGTATYDGSAIASAVIREISSNTKCRTIFSTHYHSLVDDLKSSENVFQGHMACMVENDDVDDEENPSQESLTFLYKLSDGPCPKSYGFHAARLADLPESIISLAYRKAAELETNMKEMATFSMVHSVQKVEQLQQLVPRC